LKKLLKIALQPNLFFDEYEEMIDMERYGQQNGYLRRIQHINSVLEMIKVYEDISKANSP
jgi:hypothetical protein